MPRAYTRSHTAEIDRDPGAGEWQALRGELVALLDKVESRYAPAEETEAVEPAMSALSRRMAQLRDQVEVPEPNLRRREALRTVKRAVDRFSERDTAGDEDDELTSAIAQIRSRQGAQGHSAPMPMRRGTDVPEIRELGVLVNGMTQRLERLEGELKSQRSDAGSVRDVASQVEQLTQVVELLAGAIGETGQVKRLEAQIAALAGMIEDAPKTDLSAINSRLDDVSATVGKLAELQAQQMEREISRETRATPELAKMAPAMEGIEASVRSVYDRIDAIERNVALSAGDFERLTGEMAAFTQAMKDEAGAPKALIGRVEALAERLEDMDGGAEVLALKNDIAGLRAAVLAGIEPRFARLETQIEALSDRIVPVDTSAVETQLSALMARMDDAGAQLDGLARLYNSGDDRPDFESLATMVAERTSDAVSRKAAAPVAMFGADSLKSIEDRLTGLIKSAGKTPDYETLAELVAVRTSEAIAKAGPGAEPQGNMDALEKRMTSLFNTAGKDTAERLTRLEAMLASRPEAPASPPKQAPAPVASATPAIDPFEAVIEDADGIDKLDSILANLTRGHGDAMPANPADEQPLIDQGPKPMAPSREAAAPRVPVMPKADMPAASSPHFDPQTVQRPPRPQSSLGELDGNPFSEPPRAAAPAPEPVAAVTSTSTFVAAARRAQRARQEDVNPASNNSLIGRALSRVRQGKTEAASLDAMPVAPAAMPEEKPKREKPVREKRQPKNKVEAPAAEPRISADAVKPESFLTRNRRPLLLAATLVAVSLLALNLVLQRMGPDAAPTPAAETNAAPAAEPAPVGDQSSIVPPRVIDMVDPVSTGSINPGEPMSFSQDAVPAIPAPPTLSRTANVAPASLAPLPGIAPETTGSIAAPGSVSPAQEKFDLPPEAVGPIALRQAAADGSAKAQFEVAAILGEGRAVEKDLQGAATWYERSAAQGFVPAQYRLGNLYEMGSGVEMDLEQAKLWYQRAAEAGNRMAMHNLAALHAGGQMGEQEFEAAAEWFGRAAAMGVTDSQFNLGMLYARGLGVEQDFEQSFQWFSLAAMSGDKDASQARDDIAKSLTAEAVGRIGDAVKAWKVAPVDFAANFAPIGTWNEAFDPGETIASRDVVSKVQQALNRLGFELGSTDGVAGPKTSDAIRSFERATGMSESGAVNPRLLAVLGSQPV